MASTSLNAKKGSTSSSKKPFILGFEVESMKPTLRTVLDLDPRFFPKGIQPGSIDAIRGPSGSGKTFFMTYLLARLLTLYPENSAILIDTTHHFNFSNLMQILSNIDSEIITKPDCSFEEKEKSQRKFQSYVNRITLQKCFDVTQFLSVLSAEGSVDTMLLTEPNISLVIIDAIDTFQYIPKTGPEGDFPDILKLIKTCVEQTKTPVICTLTDFFPFLQQQPKFLPKLEPDESDSPSTPEKSNYWSNYQPNIILDMNLCTGYMSLSREENQQTETNTTKSTSQIFEFQTHLRSKHNPKTAAAAFSVPNHRVKFSIFSGMLYPEDL